MEVRESLPWASATSHRHAHRIKLSERTGPLARRDLVWINVTPHPTADWIARQITEAFPWDEAPRYGIRDQDRVHGAAVTHQLRAMGIRTRPYRARFSGSDVSRRMCCSTDCITTTPESAFSVHTADELSDLFTKRACNLSFGTLTNVGCTQRVHLPVIALAVSRAADAHDGVVDVLRKPRVARTSASALPMRSFAAVNPPRPGQSL